MMLEKRRTRIEEGYEAGIYDIMTAKDKLAVLDREITAKTEELNNALNRAEATKYRKAAMKEIMEQITDFPGFLKDEDPAEVNRVLRRIISVIKIDKDGDVIISY
jgi:hypothetical protein